MIWDLLAHKAGINCGMRGILMVFGRMGLKAVNGGVVDTSGEEPPELIEEFGGGRSVDCVRADGVPLFSILTVDSNCFNKSGNSSILARPCS